MAALAAVVLALCWTAAAAQAADYRQIVLDGHTMKWGVPVAGTGASVTYAIADAPRSFPGARNCQTIDPLDHLLAASHIARLTFDHELAAAFAAWTNVADIRFREVNSADADIVIGAEANPLGRAFTNVEYSDPAATERASLKRSVICLNPNEPWKVGFDGNLNVYDIRYALTHEIGHAIGLDHPGRTGELMDFRYQEQFRVPQLGDIAGATFLYGRPPVVTAAVPGIVQNADVRTVQP